MSCSFSYRFFFFKPFFFFAPFTPNKKRSSIIVWSLFFRDVPDFILSTIFIAGIVVLVF